MKRLGQMIGLATELGMSMGLMAAGAVILGLVLGRWIDSRLGTGPLATILCIVAGAIAGQIAIYRLALDSARRLSAGAQRPVAARDVWGASGIALRLLGLMALPGIAGLLLGMWLDAILGTRVAITLTLAVAGLLGGLLAAVRLARRVAAAGRERE